MVNAYAPKTLKEALEILNTHEVTPYAGGTDLMVQHSGDSIYLFVGKLPELRSVTDDGTYIRIGAAVTFTEALENALVPAFMKEAVSRIAAPAIRNAGTFGGNLGNGSAKADSVLIEYAADAKIRLVSVDGERIIPVEQFYQGRKKLDLHKNELIAEILLPKAGLDSYYYKKVGGRNALAISRVSFAGLCTVEGSVIRRITAAFGAVSDTVLRYRDLEEKLIGKTVEQAHAARKDVLDAYAARMNLTQGRVSAEYRKQVCMNLLDDFFAQYGI